MTPMHPVYTSLILHLRDCDHNNAEAALRFFKLVAQAWLLVNTINQLTILWVNIINQLTIGNLFFNPTGTPFLILSGASDESKCYKDESSFIYASP